MAFTTSLPPKYSWLGAYSLRTELPTGVIDLGARSYVPQLGRFLQPDPQPGGSINSYAYTHDNPLNETDTSGEWSLDITSGGSSAVGTGEGVQLENGVGVAAGAIMPAPPDVQAEEAFRDDPPWDQHTAGTEEYEEYEEWEWYEEEGEYEYASYKHGAESGTQAAHLGSGLLYQPLGEADGGCDSLPVTTISSYNILDEPETTTATVVSSTRTTTMTYDGTGRLLTSEATSTEGKSLPKVTDKYSETTGQLIEQSTGSGSEAKTIKSAYNTLGQLTGYTDANGGTTTYEYEGEGSYKGEKELDGRLKFMDDGKGTQAYTYEETTGALSKLVDTQGTNVLTFTASHDVEGNMTSESYPNGMTVSYPRSATGETTGLAYEKTTHCSEKCVWFSESLVPSIHDQTLEDVSSLATNSYAYDEAGRLTQVHETPTGEYCKTRIYAYDEESDRTSLTSREPNSKKECATEGGTVEKHTYDEADRLTDTGITYNNFGDITKLPSADAGGGELQSTYYLDGQLAEQKQGEQTIGYQLDPAGRPSETIDTGTVNSTYQSHYAGPGSPPSWTIEPVSGHWTRYVSGIGGLAAIETGTSEPVLQLTDLHGDVVARASLSETATKLLSTERPTEYGVPTTSKPEKYSWLGGDLLPTELPSGVVAMGARSYVPKIGRFLQPDPMPGGTDNPYAYTNGNPVNETDLTGDYVENNYLQGFWAGQNQKAIEAEAAREQAAREAAEEAARIAAAIAAMDAKIAAEQAAINAQDLWFAEAAEGMQKGEEWWCGEGTDKACQGEGGGGGSGNVGTVDIGGSQFITDPGVPAGALCEGNEDSKKYKKEHPKLCHEIESNPWEPVEAFCLTAGAFNPFTGYECAAVDLGRAATK